MQVYVVIEYEGAGDGKVRQRRVVSVHGDAWAAATTCSELTGDAHDRGMDRIYDFEEMEVQ